VRISLVQAPCGRIGEGIEPDQKPIGACLRKGEVMRIRESLSRKRSVLLLPIAFGLLLLGLHASAMNSPPAPDRAETPDTYDIRIQGRPTLATLFKAYGPDQVRVMAEGARAQRGAMTAGLTKLQSASPGSEVRFSPLVGSAEVVRNRRGVLTHAVSARSATEVALDFLRNNASVYGLADRQVGQLQVMGESTSRESGLRMVTLRQTVRNTPVFQSQTRAIVDREGRLVRTVGRLVPGADESLLPSLEGLLSPLAALKAALSTLGLEIDASQMELRKTRREGWSFEIQTDLAALRRGIRSRLVYFPLGPGVLVPAWDQVIEFDSLQGWRILVDARTGVLLYRKNLRMSLSREEVRFSVYARTGGIPAEGPAPGSPNSLLPGSGTQFPSIARSIVSMQSLQDLVASPDGWITDHDSTTSGNNVDAFLDRSGDGNPDRGTLDNNGRPIGNPDAAGNNRDFLGSVPRDFNYSPPPAGSNPDAGDSPATPPYQRGVVTDIFYLSNYFHDRLYNLGFDEAAGNYQFHNFARGGHQGDPVEASVQAAADFGAANGGVFFIGPDGTFGDLVMLLWNGPEPDRDGALDAEVVLHELTHGFTTRVIGDTEGLNWAPAAGMGEGWSDFYALSLAHPLPMDDPDGQYPMAPYVSYKLGSRFFPSGSFKDNYVYGLRRFPYTTDNGINPLTWADADDTTIDLSGGIPPSPLAFERNGASESHNVGEIWASTLWEVRSRIIAANGGDVERGNDITLQIVSDAVRMTLVDPGFLDARDALLDADCATNACAHETSIWSGFADRGLGYKAEASLPFTINVGVKESFDLPHLDPGSVVVDDSLGNQDGFLEPGETASIRLEIGNPWRQGSRLVSSVLAILHANTGGVTITSNTSHYGPIPPQGSAFGDPFTIRLDSGLACGQSLEFSLDTISSLGPTSASFVLRVGRPSGPGAPLVFSRVIPGGLSIPDNVRGGVTDTLSVAQDLQIADLDFRVDYLVHPFVGNLSIQLKAPTGLGTNLIDQLASCDQMQCIPGQNDGDNFVNTRIDDSSSNDLLAAGASAAPFTGSWFPTFNSPRLTPTSDPVGQLSHYNGTSTRGDWKVHVTDYRAGNAGTLNRWSLIVTPVVFSCGP